MIDYIKILSLPLAAEKVLSNERLTFPYSNIATTGEVLNRAQVAHFRQMQFVVRGENVSMKGSLHKYFEGGTNFGDFTLIDVQIAIVELAEMFDFNPEKTHINFIEIGVNIPLEYDPSKLIRCLVLYRNKSFEPLQVKGKGYGRQCDTQNFTIKIYNKSLQYNLPHHLLRFEVKVKRMEFLKRYDITNLTLADLTRLETYPAFIKMLLDIHSGILLYDPDVNAEKISNRRDRELILQGRYSEYWQNIPRQKKSKLLKRFRQLAGDKMQKDTACKISNKFDELIKKGDNLTTFSDEVKTTQRGQFNPTINSYSRTCLITAINISMQKSNSQLLSNTGLRLLQINDPEKFDEIRRRFLPRRGVSGLHTKFEGDEINHISKQIRNEFYNPRKRYSKIPECQMELSY